jgi:hypothetical protein
LANPAGGGKKNFFSVPNTNLCRLQKQPARDVPFFPVEAAYHEVSIRSSPVFAGSEQRHEGRRALSPDR